MITRYNITFWIFNIFVQNNYCILCWSLAHLLLALYNNFSLHNINICKRLEGFWLSMRAISYSTNNLKSSSSYITGGNVIYPCKASFSKEELQTRGLYSASASMNNWK